MNLLLRWPVGKVIFLHMLALTIGLSSAGVATANDEVQSLTLLVKTLDQVEEAEVLEALMRGMLKGFEGRRDVRAPNNWAVIGAKLNAHKDQRVRELANRLSQIFGDDSAVQQALKVVADRKAAPESRLKMLQSLLSQQNNEVSKLLEDLLDDPQLQLVAVRGYAVVEHPDAPAILLSRYPTMSADLQNAVVETLATRKSYAESLLTAVSKNQISKKDIPTHVERSLNTILRDRFVAVFGEPRQLNADREQQIAKWKSRITPQKLADADAANGRSVFKKTCAACHLLYGEGGKIGPDLTGSNRANLDYLLLNSVDPSYDVPAAYKMVTIVTVNGRVMNGVIAEEDAVRVVLKTVEDPRLVIAKSDIDERVVSKKSMMPDGQLEALKRQEVIDLIKYLQTTEQVESAK